VQALQGEATAAAAVTLGRERCQISQATCPKRPVLCVARLWLEQLER
jgi:hypothetical protein